MDNLEKFKQYVHSRYIAWEASRGQRGDVSTFAREIGAYQGDVSHWLNGTRLPGVKVLKKITENSPRIRVQKIVAGQLTEIEEPIIGPDAWVAAGYGYLVNDPELIRTLIALEQLPRSMQQSFAAEAEKRATEYIEQAERSPSFQLAA